MFTGIVEERGVVRGVEGKRLRIGCRAVLEDSPVGASLAVNGVCLTVVERSEDSLSFDLSEETLSRTALGRAFPGKPVNLERPVTLSTRLGGHLVQGHVDGVGTVTAFDGDGTGAVLRVKAAPELLAYAVEKGSIAVDGVSLTVATLDDAEFSVALIPHTLAATNLGEVKTGDPVNLEADLIARYVARLTNGGPDG